jgi:8-oxo-dGTP pyrophosphatase MutT (NUDIX family)
MPRRGSRQPPKSEAHATLGSALRTLRESCGYRLVDLSSSRLGRKGRSEGLLSRIENGLDLPSWNVLQLYARTFNGNLSELQRLLSLALLAEKAIDTARTDSVPEVLDNSAYPLTVAVALVRRKGDVLLVRRARPEGELDWQFPSGVVKPIDLPSEAAIREVRSETGVTVKVIASLGERIHPVTSVRCIYFQCQYLEGETVNLDTNENASVSWVSAERVPEYIPIKNIFHEIIRVLNNISETSLETDEL